MQNKFCVNCGNKLGEDKKFCEYCGTNKDGEEVLKVTYEPQNNVNYTVLGARKEYPKNKISITPYILTSLITIFICLGVFFVYSNFFLEKAESTTKIEKDVTVTDEGIADAVEKIYDAVVVVESYVNGTLYSTGTGFVYKEVGDKAYILTNYHVIDNASGLYVVLTNDEKVKAEVIGGDEYSDIAVLSIASDKVLAIATIGSSEELRVGDTTFAVGAPLDASAYSWTVTRGILSGKNRLVEVATSSSSASNYVMEVLQTDTAINSGNSGGPLCNSNGEVIGVTNMKIASSQVEGMGFAIPIETAIEYADKYISGQEVTRPYLGISMYDVTSRYDNLEGIYIQYVESGSPADNAGLRTGDVIVAINNVTVQNSAYLKYELYKYSVGEEIELTIYRNNQKITKKVVLGSSK